MPEQLTVRESCEKWAQMRFKDAVETTFWRDSAIKEELARQLKGLELTEKNITGYAVEGLQRSQEGNIGKISFTGTFFEVVEETGNCTLIDYLYLLVKKSMELELGGGKISGILSRSLRTFASLLRDRDLAINLEAKIRKERTFADYEIITDPIEDSKNHTDVLLNIGENVYRIWSYQHSRMGLPHDIERITGDRGPLPNGIHILFPLKSEIIAEYEKMGGRIEKLKSALKNIDEKMKTVSRGTKGEEYLTDRKKNISESLNSWLSKYKEMKGTAEYEVDCCYGWHFYSKEKIGDLLKFISDIESGKQKPRSYAETCRILSAPKEYLSHISAFKI